MPTPSKLCDGNRDLTLAEQSSSDVHVPKEDVALTDAYVNACSMMMVLMNWYMQYSPPIIIISFRCHVWAMPCCELGSIHHNEPVIISRESKHAC